MSKFLKSAAAIAAVATGFALSPAASAQVQGIASADPSAAILSAKAIQAGYKQINTAYNAYFAQIDAKSNEITALQKQLDANKDNKLDDAEWGNAVKAKNPVVTSVQAKQQELNKLQEPIILAQLFVIENVSLQYETALQTVTAAKKVNLVLSPDVIVWPAQQTDITKAIADALDARVPTVASQPPANWRPTLQTTGALHRQFAEALQASAYRQAAAEQAQKPGTAPATPAKPKTQPDGR